MDQDNFMLPWGRDGLASLVPDLISRGEGPKVDMKRQLDIATAAEKGELLKDIQAMANTFDAAHSNHGFLLFGVDGGKLAPVSFATNEDKIQAQIDELMKNYIGPFIQTKLFIFGDPGAQHAALVIPPTRNAPHGFVREIEKFKRGDVFVRRGTTTEKALPEDFARFFRQHLDEHAYQQQVEVRELRARVRTLESNSSVSRKVPADARPAPQSAGEAQQPDDLNTAVDRALSRTTDVVSKGLVDAAAAIRDFMLSDKLPWVPQATTKEQGRDILGSIEDRSREYLRALAKLASQDTAGKYDHAVINSLCVLAEVATPPHNTAYNQLGSGLRYLPLVMALHVTFVAGAASGRVALLSRVKGLQLQSTDDYREPEAIGEALLRVRDAGAIFQTQHPDFPSTTWCDPVSEYMRPLVGAMADGTDPLLKPETAFLQGEFLLALLPLVAKADADQYRRRIPAPGRFLYSDKARRVLTRFLRENREMVEHIFGPELRSMLQEFDAHAPRLVSSRCFGDGFTSGATEAAYPGSSKTEEVQSPDEPHSDIY